ncbi:hypothetical protein DFH11DRAFT_391688 [Phellopilus nigrolimitatus]|nr:hypothetical protein DFH11DRAFT_391688 [Phellopilus nigrolimitatus]
MVSSSLLHVRPRLNARIINPTFVINYCRPSLRTTMSAPTPLPNYVYKILPNTSVYQGTPIPVPSDWEFPQTQIDLDDGFVHLSTHAQLAGTLSSFFDGDATVQLLKIDFKRASAFKVVKWEKASNGDVFPHLYARLTGDLVNELKIVAKGESWGQTTKTLEEKGWLEN